MKKNYGIISYRKNKKRSYLRLINKFEELICIDNLNSDNDNLYVLFKIIHNLSLEKKCDASEIIQNKQISTGFRKYLENNINNNDVRNLIIGLFPKYLQTLVKACLFSDNINSGWILGRGDTKKADEWVLTPSNIKQIKDRVIENGQLYGDAKKMTNPIEHCNKYLDFDDEYRMISDNWLSHVENYWQPLAYNEVSDVCKLQNNKSETKCEWINNMSEESKKRVMESVASIKEKGNKGHLEDMIDDLKQQINYLQSSDCDMDSNTKRNSLMTCHKELRRYKLLLGKLNLGEK